MKEGGESVIEGRGGSGEGEESEEEGEWRVESREVWR
jgi:hypothetical protein